jgi:hypothetical protein
MPQGVSRAAPIKPVPTKDAPHFARPCGSEGSNQTRQRPKPPEFRSFPVYAGRPPRSEARIRWTIKLLHKAKTPAVSDRTWPKSPASPQGETKPPAYPPSNLRGDEASEPTEAEFPWTWRETEPIGQFVRRTNPGATRQNPHRIPNLVSTRHLSSNRKMIAATCQSSGGESSARNEGCKRSAAPCQVGRQHFFQIVKRRDPKSRRPNCGSRGRTPERAPRKLSAA